MSGSKKRVRFSDQHEVREFQVHQDEEPERKKGRALDPMEALECDIGGVCLAEGRMDAVQAAASRAARRRHSLMAGFEGGAGSGAGGGDDDDIEGAEADYEDPEEMFTEAGIPWEPFHLKREREEGYFDPESGNYIEYKRDEVEDAWADQLANVEVDEEWLARVMRGQGRQEAEAAAAAAGGEEADLDADEIRTLKRRVVDMLLPGENVLQALRRLAAVRQPVPGGTGSGRQSPQANDPLSRHPRAFGNQAMPAAVQEKFERLTELSSILMDQGVYSVHSMTREQLESSIAGRDSGGGGGGGGSGTEGAGRSDSGSPSGGSAAAEAAALAAAVRRAIRGDSNGSGGGSSAAADAGQQLAEQLLAGAQQEQGAQRGSSSNGTNGSASGGNGNDEGAAAGPGAAMAPPVDADQDIFGDENDDAGGGDKGNAGAEVAPALPEGQQGPSRGSDSSRQAAGGQQQAGATTDAAGDVAMQDQQRPAGEGQQQRQQQQQQAPGTASASLPTAAAAEAVASAAAVASGNAAATDGSSGGSSSAGEPPELEGFVLDSSGLWYNSTMGCYYDARTRLFGDASTGQWFSYDAASGQYQLAS